MDEEVRIKIMVDGPDGIRTVRCVIFESELEFQRWLALAADHCLVGTLGIVEVQHLD